MSAKDSKSPAPAPAAAAEQTTGAPKDGAPAATASRETSPANDASEVDQKTAADASAEPSKNLAEGNHRPHPHFFPSPSIHPHPHLPLRAVYQSLT